ncbi:MULTISPECIES: hypothetical protein [Methylobacterium]|uniref:hypothetical protein n=1 Tax=Methylobacterium TaxID=407 RepID=UPI000AC797DE|nr:MULTISPECIES: hypothetical protein [Methylobacterium]MCI9882937.1 hypothetical protein [Methylobacterium goesingense]
MSEIHVVGLDLIKQIFQVHAISSEAAVVVKRQLRRSQVLTSFPSCHPASSGWRRPVVFIFWARENSRIGH